MVNHVDPLKVRPPPTPRRLLTVEMLEPLGEVGVEPHSFGPHPQGPSGLVKIVQPLVKIPGEDHPTWLRFSWDRATLSGSRMSQIQLMASNFLSPSDFSSPSTRDGARVLKYQARSLASSPFSSSFSPLKGMYAAIYNTKSVLWSRLSGSPGWPGHR
jgi:hypothetical protein